METDTKEACETLDAAFFSGDTFHNPEALAEMEEYMRRWLGEAEVIKQFFDAAKQEEYRKAVLAQSGQ